MLGPDRTGEQQGKHLGVHTGMCGQEQPAQEDAESPIPDLTFFWFLQTWSL